MDKLADSFGLDDEFGSPAESTSKPAGEVKVEAPFFQEIDLEDGSGVQRFEADTLEALNVKLTEALVNGNQEISRLRKAKPRPKPVKPAAPAKVEVPGLSVEQEIELQSLMMTDPVKAIDIVMMAKTGMSFEAMSQSHASTQELLKEQQERIVAQQFMAKHSKDYVATIPNYKVLQDVLTEQELEFNIENLDYALSVAQDSGLLEAPPKAQKVDKPAAATVKVEPVKEKTKPQHSGLTAAQTGQHAAPDAGKQVDVDELMKAPGTMEEKRSRIVQAIHQSNQASSEQI